MKILVNVIKWKSACLLLFLFSKVELEIESVIHEFRLSELLQFTTVFLGRTSETLRTVHETGDTVHLQNLILIRGCHVLQVIRDELRAHTILDQSDYLKREGDRRFTHLDHIANLDHAGRFDRYSTYHDTPFLASFRGYRAGLKDTGRPHPFIDTYLVHICILSLFLFIIKLIHRNLDAGEAEALDDLCRTIQYLWHQLQFLWGKFP